MQIREIRKACNLTMKQISEQTGISESMLSLIESGKRNPSVRVAKQIASVLGIDWTRFYDDSES